LWRRDCICAGVVTGASAVRASREVIEEIVQGGSGFRDDARVLEAAELTLGEWAEGVLRCREQVRERRAGRRLPRYRVDVELGEGTLGRIFAALRALRYA